jgi:hypothetical protein
LLIFIAIFLTNDSAPKAQNKTPRLHANVISKLYKMQSSIVYSLIIFLGLFNPLKINAQNKFDIDTNIFGGWTLGSKEFIHKPDTVEYIRYSAPYCIDTTQGRPVMKCAGIRIARNGKFYFMSSSAVCGTDPQPISTETWKIIKMNDNSFLQVFREEKLFMEYRIFSLKPTKLILIKSKL